MLGFETSDDAAVYKINDTQAAVLTVDFFTPIVDDPYDFGRVAAANSLSDIYAMGAKPHVVLNLLAFPCKLGPKIIGAVLQGANEVVRQAGAITMGGHTVEDKEPKFGLSCFGLIDSDKIVLNKGAQDGDYLYLTKNLGTGIMTTALKRSLISEEELKPVVESMATLNKEASEAMLKAEVHAGTDVTGFGLAGHLHEMCEASGLGAELSFGSLPLFEGVKDFAQQGVCPGKTSEMKSWADQFLTYNTSQITQDEFQWMSTILCDPQTSGGMLVAIAPDKAQIFEENYAQLSAKKAWRIGRITNKLDAGCINLVQ